MDDAGSGLLARSVRRAVQVVLVVFAAATLSFLLLHLAPGDPISAIADAGNVAPELLEQWRHQHGYDRALLVQYGDWLAHVARGDFGYATSQHRPVADVIATALPNTLLLMSLALLGSIAIGAGVGAWQGARAGSTRDRALSFVELIFYAIPEFVLGAALLWFVVLVAHIDLPTGGMVDEVQHDSMTQAGQLYDVARHLVLPWLSLTVIGAAVFARYQRAAVRDVSSEPFVRTARAKGLTDAQIRRQVRRAARLPVITLAGLFFPTLLTGAVFVEKIYSWPGMGYVLLLAINKRDYYLVSACIIVGSAMTVLGSLLADLIRAMVDPRLRAAT